MNARNATLEALVEEPPFAREEKEVFRLAREAMDEITRKLSRDVLARTPVGASGNLQGSIIAYVRGDIPGELRGVVASRVPHARHVEFGRQAGGAMPPWREGSLLYRWVVRKLEPRGGDFESVAFLVARVIARRGIRGRRMFSRAFEENQGWIEVRIGQLMDDIARRIGG